MRRKLMLVAFALVISMLVFCLCSCGEDGPRKEDPTTCEHDFIEVTASEFISVPATCTKQAVYKKVCSKCGEVSDETFSAGDTTDHDFDSNGICKNCGKLKTDVYNSKAGTKGYLRFGDTIYFGYYPQTLVQKSSIVKQLNELALDVPNYSDYGTWVAYGYSSHSSSVNYMWYKDVELNGSKYRAVYFTQYRADVSTNPNEAAYSYQDNNGFEILNKYWFEFEPIKWDIVEEVNSIAKLLTTSIIDSQNFYVNTSSRMEGTNRILASDWSRSSIREWLSDEFSALAFNQLQNLLLVEKNLDNKTTSNSVNNSNANVQNNTVDYTYLLSYVDANSIDDKYKQKMPTDYSKVNGAYTSSSSYGKWWTRSPSSNNTYDVFAIDAAGKFSEIQVDNTQIGIVPCVEIRLCPSEDPSGHEFQENIAPEFLKSPASCSSPAVYYKSCAKCGTKLTDTFEVGKALGHEVVEVIDEQYLLVEASCVTPAIYAKSCSRCGARLSETFEVGFPLGHNYAIEKRVDPTCEEKGYTAHICDRCGDEIKDSPVDALGHIFHQETTSKYLKTPATCTQAAVYYNSCQRCGIMSTTDTFEYGQPIGHYYGNNPDPQYLCREATCESPAIYYQSCTTCGAQSTATFGYGVALGHDYITEIVKPGCTERGYTIQKCNRCTNSIISDYTNPVGHNFVDSVCTRCEKVDFGAEPYIRHGDYIYFGSYPQSLVEDQTTLEQLNMFCGSLPTETEENGWTTYDYYYANNKAAFMWYKDLWLENEHYRGVYFTDYRDDIIEIGIRQDDEEYRESFEGYEKNNVYWFRFDGIRWRVLESSYGEATIVCRNILDSQPYMDILDPQKVDGTTFYQNDWRTSLIRQWLNEDFYDAAFSQLQKSLISQQVILSDKYQSAPFYTEDNIFILTSEDVEKYFIYGDRYYTASDYAYSQGLMPTKDLDGFATWWLRSIKENSFEYNAVVGFEGDFDFYRPNNTTLGVVPALVIKLIPCTDEHDFVSTVVAPTCTEDGYTHYVCSKCAISEKKNFVSKLGHEYVDGVCVRCGEMDYDVIRALFETKGYAHSGDTIYFGLYPQTLFNNTSITNNLMYLAKGLPTPENPNGWYSYGYYKDNNNTEAYMWYIDIYYGGQWYRGVYFTDYRPKNSKQIEQYGTSTDESLIDDNGYFSSTVYWFTHDPIKWRVLSEANSEVLLLADIVLDAQNFMPNLYDSEVDTPDNGPNIYELSFIRQWLNDDFYNTTFSEYQKSLIVPQKLADVNSIDNIFLLSVDDFLNENYGFAKEKYAMDTQRRFMASAYAKSQGVGMSDRAQYQGKVTSILTRSAQVEDNVDPIYVLTFIDDGSQYFGSTVESFQGILPALKLRIEECLDGEPHKMVDGICSKCGYYIQSEVENAISTKGYAINGQYLFFGSYPQSKVEDNTIIDAVKGEITEYPEVGDAKEWTPLTYNAWYLDLKVSLVRYRVVYTIVDDENSTVEVFKYEPIEWYIINKNIAEYVAVSKMVIDVNSYTSKEEAVWKGSSIREYLQNAMYSLMFSNPQKNYVASTIISTDNGDGNVDTSDKLWLLKYSDISSEDFINAFGSSYVMPYSDYTISAGLDLSSGGANWLLRDSKDSNSIYYVGRDGKISEGSDINQGGYGIVPVLKFDLCKSGHDFVELVSDSTLRSAATCDKPATYYRVCSVCGKLSESDNFFTDGDPLGHDFSYLSTEFGHIKCGRCEKEYQLFELSEDKSQLLFGLFPQTKVTDADLLEALNQYIISYPKPGELGSWAPFNFMASSDGSLEAIYQVPIYYYDVLFDSNKYRAVFFKECTPSSILSKNEDENINGYEKDTVYWFKYEPISWDIVSTDGTNYTLVSDLILYLSNYNNNEDVDILTNWIENVLSAQHIKLNGVEDFVIKEDVSLLSKSDVTSYYEETNRGKLSTDYAKALGLYSDSGTSKGLYWTKTLENPGAYFIKADGTFDVSSDLYMYYGIVPTIKVQVCDHTNPEYEYIIVDPTCEENGYKHKVCACCGFEFGIEIIPALGHEGGQATCSQKAICDRCHNEYGDFLPHTYTEGFCEECGHIDEDLVNEKIAEQGYALYQDRLFFGYYPQTEITDNAITSALETGLSLPVNGNNNGWTSYGYYNDNNQSDYMFYIDKTYGGIKYRGVYFVEYRPNIITDVHDDTSNVYKNGYLVGNIYWFKYEPIEWRIINSKDSQKFIICNTAIDSQAFQTSWALKEDASYYVNKSGYLDHYINDWESSGIRDWLNNLFYNLAFTEKEKTLILETELDCKATAILWRDNTYAQRQNDVEDKVFLLSYNDLINDEYGFNIYQNEFDETRQKKATDYAKIQGIGTDDDGNVNWITRNPWLSGSNMCGIVTSNGHDEGDIDVRDTTYGIVPALVLTTCLGSHNFVEMVSDDNLVQKATCTSKAVYYKVCSHCGEKSTETFESGELLPHNYYVSEISDSTCTEKGYRVLVCNDCLHTEIEEFELLPHTGGQATCSQKAICEVCGQEYGDLLEHRDYTITTIEPTCVDDGYDLYVCVDCGHEEHRNIVPMKGHKGGKATCYLPARCEICGAYYGDTVDHKFVQQEVEPTCCEDGYIKNICSICGEVVIEPGKPALGHDYQVKESDNYLFKEANCTCGNVYFYRCSRCGTIDEDNWLETTTPLGHNYDVNGVCQRCGDKLITRVNKDGVEAATGTYILFGYYPQTKVTDSELINRLKGLPSMQKTPAKDSANHDWTTIDFFANEEIYADRMWYKDIWYLGNEYRAVYFNSYRPSNISLQSSAANSFQDDNGYYQGNIYFFKFEKIKWKIVGESTGKVNLIADIALDSCIFYTGGNLEVAQSNWENSNIRAELAEFYNIAFSTTAQKQVLDTNVNPAGYIPDASYNEGNNGTVDNVYLYCYQTNMTNIKTTIASDYTKCMGGYGTGDATYSITLSPSGVDKILRENGSSTSVNNLVIIRPCISIQLI